MKTTLSRPTEEIPRRKMPSSRLAHPGASSDRRLSAAEAAEAAHFFADSDDVERAS